MTRTEAADVIANAVTADGYDTSVWAPAGGTGPVRVYVSHLNVADPLGLLFPVWGRDCQDGTVKSALEKQSGTIMALVPELEITPVPQVPAGTGAAPRVAVDEDVAAFEASERAVSRAESNREQG